MDRPDDPGGGIVPLPACFVVVSNGSEMETDASETDASSVSKGHKRSRVHKSSKHKSHKKKKEHVQDSISTEPQAVINPPTAINPSPVVESTPQKPPPVIVTRTLYESTDIAPFIVHIQRQQEAPNDGTTLHPISLGKFLKRFAFRNIIDGSVKRIGRNRCSISFSKHDDANALIGHKSLSDYKFKAFIPSYNISRMGVVRGIPIDLSPEEIIDSTSVPNGCGKILKVRRINTKQMIEGAPIWKPTQTVVVTFDGQVLPNRIFMCYNSLQVQLYTYPTIQCYNCCHFGHTKIQCRSKPRCYKCGREHSGDSCNTSEDCLSCCLCGGIHFATNKSCPEFVRQQNIKYAMADKCISYVEASRLLPPLSKSYAEIVATPSDQPTIFNNNFRQPSTASMSYRKTVFAKPRLPPKLGKGYNVKEHNDLVRQPASSISNGCAIKESNIDSKLNISDIISLLNSLIQSKVIEPSNAAKLSDAITILNNHNGSSQIQSSSMELQKYY